MEHLTTALKCKKCKKNAKNIVFNFGWEMEKEGAQSLVTFAADFDLFGNDSIHSYLTIRPILYFAFEANVWLSKEGPILYLQTLTEVGYPTQIVNGDDYDKGSGEIGSKQRRRLKRDGRGSTVYCEACQPYGKTL